MLTVQNQCIHKGSHLYYGYKISVLKLSDCDIAPWRDLSAPILNQHEWIIPSKAKTYKHLLERQTCGTYVM